MKNVVLFFCFFCLISSCRYEKYITPDQPELKSSKNEIAVYYPAGNDTIFLSNNVADASVVSSVYRLDGYFKDSIISYHNLVIVDQTKDFIVVKAVIEDVHDEELHLFLIQGDQVLDTLVLPVAKEFTIKKSHSYDDRIFYMAYDMDGIFNVNETGGDKTLIDENERPFSINHDGSLYMKNRYSRADVYYSYSGIQKEYYDGVGRFSRAKGSSLIAHQSDYQIKFSEGDLNINNPESGTIDDFSFTEVDDDLITIIYFNPGQYGVENELRLFRNDVLIWSQVVKGLLELCISSDGKSVVYSKASDYSTYILLQKYEFDSGRNISIDSASNKFGIFDVAFNSEDDKVAYIRGDVTSTDVFIKNADGSGEATNITNTPDVNEYYLDWN